MESEYHIGDIVWVKMKGYPWRTGIASKYNIYMKYE